MLAGALLCWLVCLLVGWLIGWMVEWLVCRLVGWLVTYDARCHLVAIYRHPHCTGRWQTSWLKLEGEVSQRITNIEASTFHKAQAGVAGGNITGGIGQVLVRPSAGSGSTGAYTGAALSGGS